MKYLFHLGHPAHYHLFKNVFTALERDGHTVIVTIKKKDVLEDLLQREGRPYINLQPEGRKDSRTGIAWGLFKRDFKMLRLCRKIRPDLLVGTSVEISHVGRLLGIPAVNVNEDDYDVVPLYSRLGYPWARCILAPSCCRTGKWEYKTVKYDSYHELAYLHPDHFAPAREVAMRYLDADKPYFVIRFAKLSAHHDKGIRGIGAGVAARLIEMLAPRGQVLVTSERELEESFAPHRLRVDPADMHHILAFAGLYIGDSQTMAAEAGVLGTPFIRCNDFVGRIGYLDELENRYRLGFGVKPDHPEKLLGIVAELIAMPDLRVEWLRRRKRMLAEKINAADFLSWFLGNFPQSLAKMKSDPSFQSTFKRKTGTDLG